MPISHPPEWADLSSRTIYVWRHIITRIRARRRVGDATAKAGILHSDGRKKHLHDCRGTYATHLMLAGATDQQIAEASAWAPDRVANIRFVYVDRARTIVALGERLDAVAVNRPVN